MFTTLVLASKVWDDDSYENIHFARAFTIFSLKEINDMEATFLNLIDFKVNVTSAEYAKYYFVLRAMAKDKD
jgi:hypothetical protein